ncbi:hypothetical protein [Paenisporosarcina antarctica]|nr:hypothetical protein [Paenisporosarcina antarctica]
MSGDAFFAIIPILSIFFYLAPVLFVNIQKDKNKILSTISDKLEKLNN